MGVLSVVVTDATGAVIPGARIVAKALVNGTSYEATTDATGQAVVQLNQGSYDLKVRARAFMPWEEKEVDVNTEIQRNVTLMIAENVCGPCVVVEGPEIPLEHQPAIAEIPLIPMQQFDLPAKPYRHRRHWFWF